MDLANTFNDVAGGPDSESIASDVQGPPGPAPQGISADFQANGSATPDPGPSVQAFTLVPTPSEPTAAEAELETLERGRAKPTPRNNLNPPTRVMKASHTPIERQREARVRALRAYASQQRETHDYDQEDDLELSF